MSALMRPAECRQACALPALADELLDTIERTIFTADSSDPIFNAALTVFTASLSHSIFHPKRTIFSADISDPIFMRDQATI